MTARCTERGCPVRFRAGADRPCRDHQDGGELADRMAAFGATMTSVPGERDDDSGEDRRVTSGVQTLATRSPSR